MDQVQDSTTNPELPGREQVEGEKHHPGLSQNKI